MFKMFIIYCDCIHLLGYRLVFDAIDEMKRNVYETSGGFSTFVVKYVIQHGSGTAVHVKQSQMLSIWCTFSEPKKIILQQKAGIILELGPCSVTL